MAVGGIFLDIRLPGPLAGAKETLARLLNPFGSGVQPEEPARVDVMPATREPEPLSAILEQAILVPSSRFPVDPEGQSALSLAARFAGPLNRLGEEYARGLVVYPFPDGSIVGCTGRRRFTIVVDERANLAILPWTILHGLYFLVSLLSALDRGLMLHAAALRLDGGVALFVGRSGSGKSTLVKLAGENRAIADDCVLIQEAGGGFFVRDTPFNQVTRRIKELLEPGAPAGLGLFLRKDSRVLLEPVSPGLASARILANHIHFFKHFPPRAARQAFRLTAELASLVPFFLLSFKRDNSFLGALKGVMGREKG